MEIVPLRPELHLIKPAFGQVYLWQDDSGLTMIDTGAPGSEPDLAAACAELGCRRSDLRRVVITHFHQDHAGSAAAVRTWGDVEILAHRLDAPVIRGERRGAEPVLTERELPIYQQVAAHVPNAPPSTVDRELDDGDAIDFGGGAVVISVPGHTDGSVAVWLPTRRVLFTGDLVANSPGGPILGPFNTDRDRARRSFVALTGLPASTVCFGHGDPLTEAIAWDDLRRRCLGGPDSVPDPLG
jgi:glyoxylase-like metal-dependent hydrolase (beta-lactamase superfamily II)